MTHYKKPVFSGFPHISKSDALPLRIVCILLVKQLHSLALKQIVWNAWFSSTSMSLPLISLIKIVAVAVFPLLSVTRHLYLSLQKAGVVGRNRRFFAHPLT